MKRKKEIEKTLLALCCLALSETQWDYLSKGSKVDVLWTSGRSWLDDYLCLELAIVMSGAVTLHFVLSEMTLWGCDRHACVFEVFEVFEGGL